MVFLLLAIPAVSVLLLIPLRSSRAMHAVSLLSSGLMLIPAAFVTRSVLLFGAAGDSFFRGVFYVDSLGVILLDMVLVIGFLTSVYSVGYMEAEIKHGKADSGKLRIYYMLLCSFLFTMLLALTARNMGVMWIAIEGTTLASVFLVGFHNDRHALEAAWKYVIICSVGIAIALLGIILLHFSSMGVLDSRQYLDWPSLFASADSLNGSTVRLAFLFILIGFGTKAGLAPMHTWLPDAHSQAPSPISALLSGVLLNSAMYAIIRTVAIANRCLGGSAFTGRLLIAAGLLSIFTAAVFILTQKDFKRLLAYSSIEHMGIISLAMGVFTPLSVFGGLLHMFHHSLTKSMLFLSSGTILQKYNTNQIAKIKGVLKVLPVTGLVFLLGLFAIAGAPPFSVFFSEFTVLTAVFQNGSFVLGAAAALLLAVVFAGIAITLFNLFFHGPADDLPEAGEPNIPGTVCTVVLLAAIAVTGLFLPDGFLTLLGRAQSMITGG